MRIGVGMAAILALTAVACSKARSESEGPRVDRTYAVGDFERISVAGPYTVDVKTGNEPDVRASGSEQALEQLVIEVEKGTLKIHARKDRMRLNWSKHGPVRVEVNAPRLIAADIAGSGDLSVDRVAGESFDGGVAGSGSIRLGSVAVERLKAGIAGSGDFDAGNGQASNAEYQIVGSGDLRAADVRARTVAVSIAGSGNVSGMATDTATVQIAGSGDVTLTGGAKCTVKKMGSGNVNCS